MAARTIREFGQGDAAVNASTFPDPGKDGQNRDYLAMALNESFDLPFIAPRGVTPPLVIVHSYRMTSATANAVELRTAVEAISDGDAIDTDSASSFDSDNDSGDVTVPGTAGHPDQISITLTNNDSINEGDLCRLRVTRITPAGSGASGDLEWLGAELYDDGG